MCNCSSFRENCVTHARTHARTHAHGANYDLPPASRAGDNKALLIRVANKKVGREVRGYHVTTTSSVSGG